MSLRRKFNGAQACNYMKFEEGQNKFRIVSSAVVGFEYWNNDNKPVRLKEAPKELPKDIRKNKDGESRVKHFWAFVVIDRKDSRIKICELTQASIMQAIKALVDNSDWGDPKEYDITVSRSGEGLDTKYTVQPSPHKDLTSDEVELINNTKVNLNALFTGENPFESEEVEIVEVVD